MQYKVDLGKNQSPHINYEPSTINGLKEAKQDGKEYTPHVEGNLVRESIDRQNNLSYSACRYFRGPDFLPHAACILCRPASLLSAR